MERKHRFLIAAGTFFTLAAASHISIEQPEHSEACTPAISASKEETESLPLESQNTLKALDWLEHSKSEELRCSAQGLGLYKAALLENDTNSYLFIGSGELAKKDYSSVAFVDKEAFIALSRPILASEDFDVVEAAKSLFNSYTTLKLIRNDPMLYHRNQEYRIKTDAIATSATEKAFNQAE